ncbi:MAG: hypothetical protein JRI23_13095 [Deltaproteobacteria bacterium]|nr:hypothetical protein [Deltaproteobacteria bacterium]
MSLDTVSGPEVFQEISPVAEAAEQPLLEIRYPDGIRLCVFSLLPPDYLATLLGAGVR